MKLRITQKGFEQFNGMFGVVEFKDGVSVNDVSKHEAELLSALICVETEDGHNPSTAQRIIDSYHARAEFPEQETLTPSKVVEEIKLDKDWTREELEAIADKEGIAGLRKIATPMGIKGQSVPSLIDKVIELVGEAKASQKSKLEAKADAAALAAKE